MRTFAVRLRTVARFRRRRSRPRNGWPSRAARCMPVTGPPIDGGIVLIRNGKIEAVGKDVAIPSDAKVIDATGKVVVPGFIEAHSSRGMDQSNETNPNVPFLSVVDAIDPSQDYFEECRRNGITTVGRSCPATTRCSAVRRRS